MFGCGHIYRRRVSIFLISSGFVPGRDFLPDGRYLAMSKIKRNFADGQMVWAHERIGLLWSGKSGGGGWGGMGDGGVLRLITPPEQMFENRPSG